MYKRLYSLKFQLLPRSLIIYLQVIDTLNLLENNQTTGTWFQYGTYIRIIRKRHISVWT